MSGSIPVQGMPTHLELVPYLLRSLVQLGGTGKNSEIEDTVIDIFPDAEQLLNVHYPNKPTVSVFKNRLAWARSTAYLSGAASRPSRGVYMINDVGESLLKKDDHSIVQWCTEFERKYNKKKRLEKQQNESTAPALDEPSSEVIEDQQDENQSTYDWKDLLLNRLHQMSPIAFEKYVIFLLKQYGLELSHVAGPGDEGVDAIGTAPLSPVLSSRVAVQIKRYDPINNTVSREAIALFQNDARVKGAERAIFVTLSSFTAPAKRTARQALPNVELINGDRLCELIRDCGAAGVRMEPVVNEAWFNRFE